MNRSPDGVANTVAACRASARSRLTANRPPARTALNVRPSARRQHSSVGGVSVTLDSDEQVAPHGRPSGSRAVTTDTPVGNLLISSRNRSAVTGPPAVPHSSRGSITG